MPPKNTGSDKRAEILADVRRSQVSREKSYREQALKLFPHVCGRCCREFAGKTLRELTVHHKDSDHNNNPPDGSNWELLCLYCHDEEHKNTEMSGYRTASTSESTQDPDSGFQPFAGLADLLSPSVDESDSEEQEK